MTDMLPVSPAANGAFEENGGMSGGWESCGSRLRLRGTEYPVQLRFDFKAVNINKTFTLGCHL